MGDDNFDKGMMIFLALVTTLLVVGAAAGILAGAWALWQAGKFWFFASAAAGYAIARWVTVPLYHVIRENI